MVKFSRSGVEVLSCKIFCFVYKHKIYPPSLPFINSAVITFVKMIITDNVRSHPLLNMVSMLFLLNIQSLMSGGRTSKEFVIVMKNMV